MNWPGNYELLEPMNFTTGFGWFRIPNAKPFSQYLNGRYHDPVFYAPKDRKVIADNAKATDSVNWMLHVFYQNIMV